MQRLEVSGAVRPIYGSLGVKRLIMTSHGMDNPRFYSRQEQKFSHASKTIFLSSHSKHIASCSPPGGGGVNLTTHFHLVPRIWISGCKPPLPSYASMCERGHLYPPLCLIQAMVWTILCYIPSKNKRFFLPTKRFFHLHIQSTLQALPRGRGGGKTDNTFPPCA